MHILRNAWIIFSVGSISIIGFSVTRLNSKNAIFNCEISKVFTEKLIHVRHKGHKFLFLRCSMLFHILAVFYIRFIKFYNGMTFM